VRLYVKVQPKSARAGPAGLITGADGRLRLKLKVRAAPDKGAANAEVCALAARLSGLPKTAVSVEAGMAGREKTLRLSCSDADAVLDALRSMLQEARS